jgi:ligand-binding sensor domain-containing protein
MLAFLDKIYSHVSFLNNLGAARSAMKCAVPIVLAAFFVLATCSRIHGQHHGDTQYKISNWTTDDGLPSNTIIYLYQDANEFLWIGSYDGLIRFDGTQFLTYNKNNTPALLSFHARVLKGDASGTLWIGTSMGLVKYQHGKFTDLSDDKHKLFILSLCVDEANGKIWIGTRDSGLFRYDIASNTYELVETQFANDLINEITQDNEGGIWLGSETNGLAVYNHQTWSYFSRADGLQHDEIQSLYFDASEGLFIGTSSGLYVKKDKKFIAVDGFEGLRINKIKKDKAGSLWVATATGVLKRNGNGKWKLFSKQEGLSNNDVRDIYFDEGGSVWLATYRGGLVQLRETKFIGFGASEGLDVEAIGAIAQLSKDHYVAATTDGKLFTIENQEARPYPLKTKFTQRIYNILYDNQKNLWIASYDGLLLITPDGKERLFTEQDGLPTRQLRVIHQDRNQNYWIGSRNSGLIKMTLVEPSGKPHFEHFKFEEFNKLSAVFIMAVEDDAAGNLLVATNTGGLVVIDPAGAVQSFNTTKGLVSNTTYSARADKEGVVWIATLDGIGRMENGEFFGYTKKDGLPHESVFDVMEDEEGYCWMPTSNGILRVAKQQLNDYKDGKIKTLAIKQFDKSNELRSSECTGVTRMFKARDGSLWFLMLGGLVNVHPGSIVLNEKAPNVFIEKVVADDEPINIETSVTLPSGSQRVVFNYIAVNLQYPKSVRYKYRLTNFDSDWIDAGTALQAVYTNLSGGTYTFQVIASNHDGVWNSTGASISFVVKPHYYETWWFYVLSVIGLASAIFVFIRLRTENIKRKAEELETVVELRTREIASHRDELIVLNEELRASQEEVMAQRDTLSDKNDEIARINKNLEKIVAERTWVLEEQNKRLSEYAFINAHKLRAPLASILGIINLLLIEVDETQKLKLLDHLQKSSLELDEVVRTINQMLEQEFGKGKGEGNTNEGT